MADENNLGGKVGLDVTEFKTGITQLNASVKSIEAGFRASAAVMGNWSSSTNGLQERTTSLSQKLDLQKQKLNILHEEYDKVVKSSGATSSAAESLAGKMFSAEKAIASTEKDLSKYSEQLKAAQKNENESGSSLAKLGSSFSKMAEQSKKSTSAIKDHFGSLKSTITGAIGGIIAGMSLKEIISDTDAADKNLAQMSAVLKSTGDASGMTKQQLISLADAQEKNTTYSKSATEAAENMLLTFTGIGKNVFPQTVKATEDMATAMHTDATTAAMTLGKALNDPTAGLTKLTKQGVTFTDAQKKQIAAMQKAGNTAGAQTIMLKELEREFGNSAKAAGDTMPGQIQKMTNSVKDAGVETTSALAPIITNTLPSVVSAVQSIAAMVAQHKAQITGAVAEAANLVKGAFSFVESHGNLVKGALIGIATAVGTWKAAMLVANTVSTVHNALLALGVIASGEDAAAKGTQAAATVIATDAQAGLNTTMLAGALPILGIVAAIAALAAGAYLVVKNWSSIKAFFGNLWNGIKSGAESLGNNIKNAFDGAKQGVQGAWSNAGSWFSSAGEKIKSAFNATISWIKQNWKSLALFLVNPIAGAVSLLYNNNPKFKAWADSAMNTVKTGFTNGVNSIKNFFVSAWNGAKSLFTTIGSGIAGFFLPGLNNLKTNFLYVWDSIKGGLVQAWNGMKTVFSGAIEFIKAVVLGPILLLIDTIKGIFTGNFTDLKNDVTNLGQKLRESFLTMGQGFIQIFAGIWNAITGGVQAFWNVMVNGFVTLWNSITGTITTVWNNIYSFFTGMWNKIVTTFKPDMISNGFKSAWSAITGAWNGAVGWFGNVWNGIKDHFKPSMISDGFKSAWSGVQGAWKGAQSWFGGVWDGIKNHFKPDMISSGFKNAWSGVQGAWHGAGSWFGGIWKSIKDGFSKLNPIQWGKDLIDNLAKGIRDAADHVKQAVGNVAQDIRKFLHFSEPDEGPLKGFHTWMPDFMGGLADSITASKYKVAQAIQGLSTDMSIGVRAQMQPAYAGTYALPQQTTVQNNVTLPKYLYATINLGGQELKSVLVPIVGKALESKAQDSSYARGR